MVVLIDAVLVGALGVLGASVGGIGGVAVFAAGLVIVFVGGTLVLERVIPTGAKRSTFRSLFAWGFSFPLFIACIVIVVRVVHVGGLGGEILGILGFFLIWAVGDVARNALTRRKRSR